MRIPIVNQNWWRVLAVTVALCLLGGGARGEAAMPPDGLPEVATDTEKTLYREGMKHLRTEGYREAARHFEKLAKEARNPAVKTVAHLALAAACLEDGRLKEAEKAFEELPSPDEVTPSLRLRIAHLNGCLQWRNGNREQALAIWSQPLDGVQKVPHDGLPLLERLVDGCRQIGRQEQTYRWQRKLVPLLRQTAPETVAHLLEDTLRFPIRIQPDLDALQALYLELRGFDRVPIEKMPPNPLESRPFWTRVRRLIRQFDDFAETRQADRREYFRYWANAMNGRFTDWDDYQVDRADFRLMHDQDREKWRRRLDEQFKRGESTPDRIIQWVRLYKEDPEHLEAFCAEIAVAELPPAEALRVVKTLFEYKAAHGVARRFLERMDLDRLDEGSKLELARFLWHRAPDLGRTVCGAIEDRNAADLELLRFFHWRHNSEEGIPVAERLVDARHAVEDVQWMQAELLEWAKRHEEAAGAFQSVQRQPAGIMRAAECLAAAGRPARAIEHLETAAQHYPDQAQQLLLKAARLAKTDENKEQHRELLRQVVETAPDSTEADEARKLLAELD